jgi:hypothetical protein
MVLRFGVVSVARLEDGTPAALDGDLQQVGPALRIVGSEVLQLARD